jgi:hypothetical protein
MGRDLGHSLDCSGFSCTNSLSRNVTNFSCQSPCASPPTHEICRSPASQCTTFIPLVKYFGRCWFGRYVLAPCVAFPCQTPVIMAIISDYRNSLTLYGPVITVCNLNITTAKRRITLLLLLWNSVNAMCVYCCWATCHCQLDNNTQCCKKVSLWKIYVAGKKKHKGLHVKCSMLHLNKRMVACSWPSLDTIWLN